MEWVGVVVGLVGIFVGIASGGIGAGVAIGIMRGQVVSMQKRLDRLEERIDQVMRNGRNNHGH